MLAQAELPIWEHLSQGGAAVAVIVVVVLFLRARQASDVALQDIVTKFTAETREARHDYREHITGIMTSGLQAHAETREAIRGLDATLSEFRRSIGGEVSR